MSSDTPVDGRELGRQLQEPLRRRRKLHLAVEIFATYVRLRVVLARQPLPVVLADLRRDAEQRPEVTVHDQVIGIRLGRAVSKALSPLPFDSRCLVRSLVLTRMLARRGIAARLVIGVEPGPEFSAHAWVEADGVPLLPADDTRFSRITEL
jgi:Transglutaminase-like superfamily